MKSTDRIQCYMQTARFAEMRFHVYWLRVNKKIFHIHLLGYHERLSLAVLNQIAKAWSDPHPMLEFLSCWSVVIQSKLKLKNILGKTWKEVDSSWFNFLLTILWFIKFSTTYFERSISQRICLWRACRSILYLIFYRAGAVKIKLGIYCDYPFLF